MTVKANRYRTRLAQANFYAMNFAIAEVISLDTSEYYSKDSLVVLLKARYGIKSRVKLWYWSQVYSVLIAYYRRVANKAAKKCLKEQLNK